MHKPSYRYINLSSKLQASRKFIILFADYNLVVVF